MLIRCSTRQHTGEQTRLHSAPPPTVPRSAHLTAPLTAPPTCLCLLRSLCLPVSCLQCDSVPREQVHAASNRRHGRISLPAILGNHFRCQRKQHTSRQTGKQEGKQASSLPALHAQAASKQSSGRSQSTQAIQAGKLASSLVLLLLPPSLTLPFSSSSSDADSSRGSDSPARPHGQRSINPAHARQQHQ